MIKRLLSLGQEHKQERGSTFLIVSAPSPSRYLTGIEIVMLFIAAPIFHGYFALHAPFFIVIERCIVGHFRTIWHRL